ncbi:MAG: hypothetical protein QOJ27_2371 [Sphingomonadales bacterium]|nr:hypothetical protein [Sphingomonadales bacterium]
MANVKTPPKPRSPGGNGRTFLLALALIGTALATPASARPRPTPASSPVDIGTLHLFAECLVDRYRPGVRRLLAMDYRSRSYDNLLRTLSDEGARCLPFAFGKLRSSGVLLAGAFAEALLPAALNGARLADRVAYDPSRPPIAARDEGEYLGLCAVRTMPDEVAALLAAKPAKPEEQLAIARIRQRLGSCIRAGAAARVNVPGLRALLALAAYRLVSQAAPPSPRPTGS